LFFTPNSNITSRPGKLADLILVDGDPTMKISDIRRVVTVTQMISSKSPVSRASSTGRCNTL
jgi:imidazolonepropionase-like amidohydrolase